MKHNFFSSLISRVFPDGRPTVESGALGTSPFRHLLLLLAFILLPMTGWGQTKFSATANSATTMSASVGSVSVSNASSQSTNPGAIKLNSSGYIQCTPASGKSFAAGDKLTVTCYNQATSSKTMGFKLNGTEHTLSSKTAKQSNASIEYTLVATDIESDGKLKIYRYSSDAWFVSVTVSSVGGVEHSITYANTKGASTSNLPTKYYEGTGITSFSDLSDVAGWKFTGWNPSSIPTTAKTDQTITAQWEEDSRCFIFTKTGQPTSGNLAAGDAITATGGSMKVYSTKTTSSLKWASDGLNFSGGAADQVEIKLTKLLSVGTTIKLTLKNNSLNILDKNGNLVTTISSTTGTYTVVANDGLAGTVTFRIQRGGGSSYLQGVEVANCGGEALFHTVSFDMNGATSAAIADQSVLDGDKATKPADPTKPDHVFKGWVIASTGAAYDFNATVTADVALKAKWAALHTITYAETKDADMSAYPTTYEEGVGVASFTALSDVEGFKFLGWDPSSISNTANTDQTITAQWQEAITYTVKYYDDAKLLGSESVVKNEFATATGIKTDSLLYTFQGWSLTKGGDIVPLNTIAITQDTSFYGNWTKAYAQSIDAEQFVMDYGKSAIDDFKALLTARHFDHNNVGSLDSLNKDKTINNYPYLGAKFNKTGAYVSGYVQAKKLITVKLGAMNTAAKWMIDGDSINKFSGSSDSVPAIYYYYDENAEHLFRLQMRTDKTCMLKAILVTDPYKVSYANGGEISPEFFKGDSITLPAATGTGEFQGWFSAETGGTKVGMNGDMFVPFSDTTLYAQFSVLSTDNSLKTLKYGETSIAIVAEQTEYAVNLPYKTAIPATVTYEANSPVATPTGEQSANVVDGVASFTITAESGDAANYTVTFTVAPKDPLCIIKATHTGATTADVTGLIGGTVDKNTQSGGKLGGDGHYFGIKLAEGTFLPGDKLTIYASATSTKVQIFSDKGTTMLNEGVFGEGGIYTFTLTAATEWIYLYRTSSAMNPTVGYMQVDRPMNPVLTALTVAGEAATIDEANKTISVALPNGTVPSSAIFVPTIVANCDNPTAVLNGTLAYDTPIKYYIIDKDNDTTTYVLTATEKAAPAAVPEIKTQPVSAQYYDTATVIAPLTVAATVTDAGTLSYKWYKEQEGDDAQVGTGTSYTPTAAGSYYAIATNTLGTETASATSNVAVITISHLYTFKDWDGTSTTFTKAGEWTMYSSANSGKEIGTSTTFKADQQVNYAGDKANVNQTQYVTVVFAKDMKAVQLVAYNSSSRSLNNIYTLNVDAKKLTDVTSSYTKSSSQDATTKVSTMDATGHFEADVYYVFKFSSSCNLFDFFTTEAVITEGPTASIVSGTIDDEALSADEIATLNSAKALTLTTKFVAEPEIQLIQHTVTTYDDEFVKTVKDTVDAVVTTSGTNFIATCTFGTQDYVITCPINTDPALELTLTSGTAAISGKTNRSKSFETSLSGINLADGQYDVTVPNVEGLTVTPTTFTVTDGKVAEDFTITYASDADVAENTVNIDFTVGALTASFALTYSSVAWVDFTQLDVTGDMTWDFTKVPADTALARTNGIKATEDNQLMANIGNVANNDDFHSQMLVMGNTGDYVYRGRDSKGTLREVFQGKSLKFRTTIPGKVSVTGAAAGSGSKLSIGGVDMGTIGTSNTTFTAAVPAGDVEILIYEGTQPLRISSITFTASEVVRSGLTSGKVVTYCNSKQVTAFWGAKFYYISDKASDLSSIELTEVDTLAAGYPYIVIAEDSEVRVVYGTEEQTTAQTYNGLHGVLGATVTLVDGDYLIKNNKYYRAHTGNNNTIADGRAFLRLSEIEPTDVAPGKEQPAPSPRRIRLGSAEAQTATGVDAILMDAEGVQKMVIDNQVVIIRNGRMFNAQGALLR